VDSGAGQQINVYMDKRIHCAYGNAGRDTIISISAVCVLHCDCAEIAEDSSARLPNASQPIECFDLETMI
jgi:hypothetical protein